MSVFDYRALDQQKEAILTQCHDHGYFAVSHVPGFKAIYEDFLKSAQAFVKLAHEERALYSPPNSYELGWSYGTEKFYGVQDSFKGSYYGEIEGEDMDKNIWPTAHVPDFEKNYMALAGLIFKVGKELCSPLGLRTPIHHGKIRMLYYGEAEDDGNPMWCGVHRDHGLITGLCPALYLKNGIPSRSPEGSGLKIRDKIVEVPDDAIIYQIGEVAQLVTDGALTATDHGVVKSYGYERYTLAVFLNPEKNTPLYSNILDYADRFKPGVSFEDWSQASYRKYYAK